MANIVSLIAVKFSNERVRPSSDLLSQAYYLAVAAGNRWTTLGSGQPALDQMQVDLLTVANRIISAYDYAYWTEKNWFMTGLAAMFPNDASAVFDNGGASQRTDAPLLTGAKVTNVVTRCQEFQNWLLSTAGSFTVATRSGVAWLNTVLQCSSYAASPIVLADAQNFITRCSELQTNYQAASNANLTTLLSAAVNPNR